jgi:hypothetical protein
MLFSPKSSFRGTSGVKDRKNKTTADVTELLYVPRVKTVTATYSIRPYQRFIGVFGLKRPSMLVYRTCLMPSLPLFSVICG